MEKFLSLYCSPKGCEEFCLGYFAAQRAMEKCLSLLCDQKNCGEIVKVILHPEGPQINFRGPFAARWSVEKNCLGCFLAQRAAEKSLGIRPLRNL